jgi:hypothetical protein
MPHCNAEEFAVILERLRNNDPSLTRLDLGWNQIGDAEAKDIALQDNTTLTTLDLGFNFIGDAGAIHISLALKNNTTLTSLDLRCNQIRVAKTIDIISILLKDNMTLTTLQLDMNKIDTAWVDEWASDHAETIQSYLKRNRQLAEQQAEQHVVRGQTYLQQLCYSEAIIEFQHALRLIGFSYSKQKPIQEILQQAQKTQREHVAATTTAAEQHYQSELKAQLLTLNQEYEELSNIPSVKLSVHLGVEQKRLQTELDQNKQQQAQLRQQLSELKSQSSNAQQFTKMQAQLADLERIQPALQMDYEVKMARLEAEKTFQASPNLWQFYRTIFIALETFAIGCKSISSGLAQLGATGELSSAATGVNLFNTATSSISALSQLVALVPVIGSSIGTILSIANHGLTAVDQKRLRNVLKTLSELGTSSDFKKLAEVTARQLTERYAKEQLVYLLTLEQEAQQIEARKTASYRGKLKEGGKELLQGVKEKLLKENSRSQAQALADLVIGQIIGALLDGSIESSQPLAPQLIDVITTPPSKLGHLKQVITDKLGMDELITTVGRTWRYHEILCKPGIKTQDGKYFSGGDTQPELYGYRLGTAKEALALKMHQTKTENAAALQPVSLMKVDTHDSKPQIATVTSYQTIQQGLTQPSTSAPQLEIAHQQQEVEELKRQLAKTEAEMKILRDQQNAKDREDRETKLHIKRLEEELKKQKDPKTSLEVSCGNQALLYAKKNSQTTSTSKAADSPVSLAEHMKLVERFEQLTEHVIANSSEPELQKWKKPSDEKNERERNELLELTPMERSSNTASLVTNSTATMLGSAATEDSKSSSQPIDARENHTAPLSSCVIS